MRRAGKAYVSVMWRQVVDQMFEVDESRQYKQATYAHEYNRPEHLVGFSHTGQPKQYFEECTKGQEQSQTNGDENVA